jgi:hypothetical protein
MKKPDPWWVMYLSLVAAALALYFVPQWLGWMTP